MGGTKLNCPNGIEFLPGIFIASALRVRRHFYETRAAFRNRVAHNRARRKIFPQGTPPRAMKRGASKLEARSRRKNSTKAIFLRGGYLIWRIFISSQKYARVFPLRGGILESARAHREKRGGARRKNAALSLVLQLDDHAVHVNARFSQRARRGFAWNRYRRDGKYATW